MTGHKGRALKEIFADALELPPEKREAFLNKACGSNGALRETVGELLVAHERAGDLFEHPTFSFAQDVTEEDAAGEAVTATGSVLCGRYRIVGLLGRGGMGEVYAAFDEELSTYVALKTLSRGSGSAEHQARFRREILMARAIMHPNVCRVFDYHRETGAAQDSAVVPLEFISMERLSGETLAARLKRGRIPHAEALSIMRQVCSGVGALHSKGIIHRDLKPSNIMLEPAQAGAVRAVIMDFGLARETGAAAGDHNQFKTVTGQVFGTPAYSAPEQLRGDVPGPPTDVYALGLILYEMLAGARPFAAADSQGSGWKRLTDDAPVLNRRDTGVTAAVNRVVAKCLERDPKRRFQSADELLATLNGKRPAPKLATLGITASVILVSVPAVYFWNSALRVPPLPAEKHVIVLPFTGSEAIGMSSAFGDGVAGTLTGKLAGLEQPQAHFWVVPFADVQRFGVKDSAGARTLVGANLALQGAFRKKADAIEFDLQLRDTSPRNGAATGFRHRRITVPMADLSLLGTSLFENAAALLEMKAPPDGASDTDLSSTAGPGAWQFYQQGLGYMQRYGADNEERAVAMFRRALHADKTYTAAWAGLAQAYIGQFSITKDPRWLDQGEEAARHALTLDPDRAQVHLSLGMINFNRGNFGDAIGNFQTASGQDRTLTTAITMLARSHESLGQILQAEGLFQQAISMAPDYWSGYNDLGLLYYRNGQYVKAEPLFRTVTELTPENPLAFANLGGVLLAQDRYAEARKYLERALALRPVPQVYSNLGTALYWEKKYQESAAMFRKAVGLTPKDSRFWKNLGDALERIPDPNAARGAYGSCADAARRQMERSVASPSILSVYAICLAKTGSGALARATIEKALARSPGDNEVQFHAALVYAVLGYPASALESLDKIFTAGYPRTVVLNTPELAPLRNTPRFQKWVSK